MHLGGASDSNALVGEATVTDSRISEVRATVEAFDPQDVHTARCRTTILQNLETLPEPFSEDADPIHVTASAVVVSSAGVLLHRHKRMDVWVGPGGHIEAGESPGAAVLRETLEESGVQAHHPAGGPQLLHVDVHPGPKGHTHLDLRWLLYAEPVECAPGPGESPEVGWFTYEEASERVPEDYRIPLRDAFGRSDG